MSERRTRREQREEEERRLELERRRRIAIARKRRQQQIRRQKMMMAGAGLAILVIGAAAFAIHGKIEEKKAKAAQEKQKETEAKAKAEEENNTLHMVAAGDNLIHDALINAGKENDWNFDFLYENIKKVIKDAGFGLCESGNAFGERSMIKLQGILISPLLRKWETHWQMQDLIL